MKDIKTILVPTDFSEASKEAARRAKHLAEAFGSKLNFVHVMDNRYAQGLLATLTSNPVSHWLEITNAASKRLEEFTADYGDDIGQTILEGTPWEEILKEAEKISADMIVIGSRGRTGLERAFIGSQAEGITRHTKLPVLVVHGPEEA